MIETTAMLCEIRPDADQPRKYFKASALKALARSLQLVGQRTPIEVKRLPPVDGFKFEIIDGERRWRAAQIAGLETIRITVEERELDRRKQHLLSTISNFHREGHTHIEISDALAYQRSLGETVAALADNLDKSEGWVYQYLKLQELVPALQAKMHPETRDQEMIRFVEAVVLGSLKADQQETVYREGFKYERGEKIAYYRRRAAQLQGKERIGRPQRPQERLQSYLTLVDRVNQYLDVALDLKEKEFDKMLAAARINDIRRMTERLCKVRDDIGALISIIEKKSIVGKGEGDIPGMLQSPDQARAAAA